MGLDVDPQMLGILAGAAGGIAMASRQKAASMPAMPAPDAVPESQAAKAPDVQDVLKQMTGTGQAGGSPGISQTFLTGAGGVDRDRLTLMRNKLYGGG